MNVWQVKIETLGTFCLKKCPSGNELCEILDRNAKIDNPLLSEIQKALKQKGWEDRKLPSLVSLNLGNDCGTISIYCTPIEVLE